MSYSFYCRASGSHLTPIFVLRHPVNGRGNLHALVLHLGDEILLQLFEARNGARGVLQEDKFRDVAVVAEVVRDVADGVRKAVATGFPGDQDDVGPLESADQPGIDLRRRIFGVRNVSLDRAVMLGPRVRSLGHEVDRAEFLLLPLVERDLERGGDVVARVSDDAVRRPDAQRVPSVLLQRLHVVERPLLPAWLGGAPQAARDVSSCDDGKRIRVIPGLVHPKDRVGDGNEMVTVEGDVDHLDLITNPVHEDRKPLNILVGPIDVERTLRAAEVILRVDDEQVNLLHDILLICVISSGALLVRAHRDLIRLTIEVEGIADWNVGLGNPDIVVLVHFEGMTTLRIPTYNCRAISGDDERARTRPRHGLHHNEIALVEAHAFDQLRGNRESTPLVNLPFREDRPHPL